MATPENLKWRTHPNPISAHQTSVTASSQHHHLPWAVSLWAQSGRGDCSGFTLTAHQPRGQDQHWCLWTLARWNSLCSGNHWNSGLLWCFVLRNMERGQSYKVSYPESCGRHSFFFLFWAQVHNIELILPSDHNTLWSCVYARLFSCFIWNFFLLLSLIPRHCCLLPAVMYSSDTVDICLEICMDPNKVGLFFVCICILNLHKWQWTIHFIQFFTLFTQPCI